MPWLWQQQANHLFVFIISIMLKLMLCLSYLTKLNQTFPPYYIYIYKGIVPFQNEVLYGGSGVCQRS